MATCMELSRISSSATATAAPEAAGVSSEVDGVESAGGFLESVVMIVHAAPRGNGKPGWAEPPRPTADPG